MLRISARAIINFWSSWMGTYSILGAYSRVGAYSMLGASKVDFHKKLKTLFRLNDILYLK